METVLRAVALCLVGCVLAQLLKKDVPALQLLLTLGIVLVLAIPAVKAAQSLGELLQELAELAGIGENQLAIVVKCAAMAAVVRLGGDICRDAGQSALATLMEITGAVAAMLVTLPLFRSVLETILGI